MERTILAKMLLAGFLLVSGCASERYSDYDRESSSWPDSLSAMKKHDIIALSKAGIADSVILTMIDVSGSFFHLTPQDVIGLADSGVSHNVINSMIRTDERSQTADDSRAHYYHSPYYWYAGWWYPFWDPWYFSPSLSLGFGYYGPIRVHRVVFPHYGFSGHQRFHGAHQGGGGRWGGGVRGSGARGGGRHR